MTENNDDLEQLNDSNEKAITLFDLEILADSKPDTKIYCWRCSEAFSVKDNFDNHSCAQQTVTTVNEFKSVNIVSLARNQSRFQCKVCYKSFISKAYLDRHSYEHNTINDKSYECDICKKSFKSKFTLTDHKRLHTGEKLYKCDLCNRSFSRQLNLTKHKLKHTGEKSNSLNAHSGEKPFQCVIHNRTHSGVKPYQFSEQLSSKKPNRMHTNDDSVPIKEEIILIEEIDVKEETNIDTNIDPLAGVGNDDENQMKTSRDKNSFQCAICNQYFSDRSNFIVHNRLHTGEKVFECTICNKFFRHQSLLVAHNRVHNRPHTGKKVFKCTMCNKCFRHQSQLVIHKRVHTGEKPYQCSTCQKSFTQKSSLKSHNRVHAGDKRYPCTVCKKSFSYKTNLILHSRVHIVLK